MDDEAIVDLFWRRDEQAISAAKAKFSAYCQRVAMDILHNAADAEECLNDAWLKAWQAIPPARPERLAVYLGTIVRRLSLNRYRDIHADKRGGSQVAAVLEELAELVVDDSAEIDAGLDEQLALAAINLFLREQPQRLAAVFVLRYWHLKSIDEIAQSLQTSPNAVKQSLFRLRRQLQATLQEEGIYL